MEAASARALQRGDQVWYWHPVRGWLPTEIDAVDNGIVPPSYGVKIGGNYRETEASRLFPREEGIPPPPPRSNTTTPTPSELAFGAKSEEGDEDEDFEAFQGAEDEGAEQEEKPEGGDGEGKKGRTEGATSTTGSAPASGSAPAPTSSPAPASSPHHLSHAPAPRGLHGGAVPDREKPWPHSHPVEVHGEVSGPLSESSSPSREPAPALSPLPPSAPLHSLPREAVEAQGVFGHPFGMHGAGLPERKAHAEHHRAREEEQETGSTRGPAGTPPEPVPAPPAEATAEPVPAPAAEAVSPAASAAPDASASASAPSSPASSSSPSAPLFPFVAAPEDDLEAALAPLPAEFLARHGVPAPEVVAWGPEVVPAEEHEAEGVEEVHRGAGGEEQDEAKGAGDEGVVPRPLTEVLERFGEQNEGLREALRQEREEEEAEEKEAAKEAVKEAAKEESASVSGPAPSFSTLVAEGAEPPAAPSAPPSSAAAPSSSAAAPPSSAAAPSSSAAAPSSSAAAPPSSAAAPSSSAAAPSSSAAAPPSSAAAPSSSAAAPPSSAAAPPLASISRDTPVVTSATDPEELLRLAQLRVQQAYLQEIERERRERRKKDGKKGGKRAGKKSVARALEVLREGEGGKEAEAVEAQAAAWRQAAAGRKANKAGGEEEKNVEEKEEEKEKETAAPSAAPSVSAPPASAPSAPAPPASVSSAPISSTAEAVAELRSALEAVEAEERAKQEDEGAPPAPAGSAPASSSSAPLDEVARRELSRSLHEAEEASLEAAEAREAEHEARVARTRARQAALEAEAERAAREELAVEHEDDLQKEKEKETKEGGVGLGPGALSRAELVRRVEEALRAEVERQRWEAQRREEKEGEETERDGERAADASSSLPPAAAVVRPPFTVTSPPSASPPRASSPPPSSSSALSSPLAPFATALRRPDSLVDSAERRVLVRAAEARERGAAELAARSSSPREAALALARAPPVSMAHRAVHAAADDAEAAAESYAAAWYRLARSAEALVEAGQGWIARAVARGADPRALASHPRVAAYVEALGHAKLAAELVEIAAKRLGRAQVAEDVSRAAERCRRAWSRGAGERPGATRGDDDDDEDEDYGDFQTYAPPRRTDEATTRGEPFAPFPASASREAPRADAAAPAPRQVMVRLPNGQLAAIEVPGTAPAPAPAPAQASAAQEARRSALGGGPAGVLGRSPSVSYRDAYRPLARPTRPAAGPSAEESRSGPGGAAPQAFVVRLPDGRRAVVVGRRDLEEREQLREQERLERARAQAQERALARAQAQAQAQAQAEAQAQKARDALSSAFVRIDTPDGPALVPLSALGLGSPDREESQQQQLRQQQRALPVAFSPARSSRAAASAPSSSLLPSSAAFGPGTFVVRGPDGAPAFVVRKGPGAPEEGPSGARAQPRPSPRAFVVRSRDGTPALVLRGPGGDDADLPAPFGARGVDATPSPAPFGARSVDGPTASSAAAGSPYGFPSTVEVSPAAFAAPEAEEDVLDLSGAAPTRSGPSLDSLYRQLRARPGQGERLPPSDAAAALARMLGLAPGGQDAESAERAAFAAPSAAPPASFEPSPVSVRAPPASFGAPPASFGSAPRGATSSRQQLDPFTLLPLDQLRAARFPTAPLPGGDGRDAAVPVSRLWSHLAPEGEPYGF